jgi:hypothetical protein
MKGRNVFRMGKIRKRTQKLSGKHLETRALKGEQKCQRTFEYDVKGNILLSRSGER